MMNVNTIDNIRNADDKGLKEECRRSIRRLSMGSSFISEGRTILDDDQNRVAPNGRFFTPSFVLVRPFKTTHEHL